MAEGKRGGFHSLEKKIHEIEEQDRTTERKSASDERGQKQREPEARKETPRRPPPAHDE